MPQKIAYILRFISISFLVRLLLLFRLLFVIYSKHEQTFCDCDNFSRFSFPFSLLYESFREWLCTTERIRFQFWAGLVRCCFAVIPCWCIISVFRFFVGIFCVCLFVVLFCLEFFFIRFAHILDYSSSFKAKNSSLGQMFGWTAVLSSQDGYEREADRNWVLFFLFIVCVWLVWAFIRYEICQVKVERRLFSDCDCIRKLVRPTTTTAAATPATATTAIN